MKKLAPLIAVVVLVGAAAVAVYFATRPSKTPDPPANGPVVQKNLDFKTEDFMFHFDLDDDGKVSFEEFSQRYGQGDPPLVFTEKDGAEPMTAAAAFKQWDRNKNGYVDSMDMRELLDKNWLRRAEEARRRGLHAVDWNGMELLLNEHQVRTFETETAAMARGELPFAGTFWKAHHLKGRWSRVVETGGEFAGYLTERDGRVFLLTEKAELQARDPAKVQVIDLPADDPHMLYAAEIAKIRFDNPAQNLALAQRCMKWGMRTEAGMLYARVLVMQPDNQEALDTLGYRREGDKFVSKGE